MCRSNITIKIADNLKGRKNLSKYFFYNLCERETYDIVLMLALMWILKCAYPSEYVLGQYNSCIFISRWVAYFRDSIIYRVPYSLCNCLIL